MAEYAYSDYNSNPDPPHQPLFLRTILKRLAEAPLPIDLVLDAGCGDGNFAADIAEAGYQVCGVDLASTGIDIARSRGVGNFQQASLYDDLRGVFSVDSFDAVISVEVIEHLYDPRAFVARVHEALRPGGTFIVTTPYWGYAKNIAMAVTNRMDGALTPLWDGGHIKHFSRKTLTELLVEQGFTVRAFDGDELRPRYLWRGMVMTCERTLS